MLSPLLPTEGVSAPVRAAWNARGPWRAPWAWAAAVLLFAATVHPPLFPFTGLDGSWILALAYAQEHGLVWGRDIVFTFGPLGVLQTEVFTPWHWWPHWAWQVFRAGTFAWAAVELAALMPSARRWAWTLFLALVMARFNDALIPAQVAILGAWLLAARCRPAGPALRAGILAAGTWLGVASLMKFPVLLLAGLVVAVAALTWLVAGRPLGAFGVLLVPLGAFSAGWMAVRQPLDAIPDYLRAAAELSSAYAGAMELDGSWTTLWLGLSAALGVGLWLVALLPRPGGWSLAPGVMLLGAGAFLAWKQGFVRADVSTGMFFLHVGFLAVGGTVLCGASLRAAQPRMGRLALLAASFVAVAGFTLDPTGRVGLTLAGWRTTASLARLLRDRGWDARAEWQRQWDATPHPRLAETRARIAAVARAGGGDTLDVLGPEQSVAVLGGFHYAPRPVFQSYAAVTRGLLDRNAAFYRDPSRAPRWVLQQFHDVDGRFPGTDESDLVAALARDYEMDGDEDGFVRWRRRDRPGPAGVLRPTSTIARAWVRAGEESVLPAASADSPRWLRVRWELSALGRARDFLYKPPPVALEAELTDGTILRGRLPLAMARHGLLLDPPASGAQGWSTLLAGRLPTFRVRAVRLVVPPGEERWLEPRAELRWESVPAVPQNWQIYLPEGGVDLRGALPAGVREVESPHLLQRTILAGQPAALLHAPSSLELEVSPDPAGRALLVSGCCGLPEGAWNGSPGTTDGAGFTVAWRGAEGDEILLWTRLLDPRAREADRGAVEFQARVAAESTRRGGRVILRTSAGPANDPSWDWTSWSGVRVERVAEQAGSAESRPAP